MDRLPSTLFNPSFLAICLCCIILLHYATSKSTRGGINSIAPRWKGWFSFAFFLKGKDFMEEGFRKFPNTCFRMPLFPFGTIVVVNGRKHILDIKTGADDTFCFLEFSIRVLQARYTFGKEITEDHYHVPVIRTTLTRNLATVFPNMTDEMRGVFNDTFGESLEWRQVNALSSLMQIVCRTSNRVIVGEALCRNQEYLKMNVDYTVDVAKSAFMINTFPAFLHPIVGPLLSRREYYCKKARRLLKDEIESRWAGFEKYGPDWADKPNDYLTWLMEAAPPGPERTVPFLANRLLFLNFAAIHTSSITFTQALLHLASHPEWVKPIREEVERVIKDEGWTKASMQKMRRTDSFLRESSRMNTIGLASLSRLMLKDYTFSDGSKVRKGDWVTASALSAHMDNNNYEQAEKFDPFRFSELRNEDNESTKHQMVATSPEYLAFGLGKHACPGRFFAANEIKAMLCYLVMYYDVKLPGDSRVKPPNQFIGAAVIPSFADQILVRKRADARVHE